MKASTLVLCCSALLDVSWGQTVVLLLLAPPESMDLAKVMTKKTGDGESIVMSRATDDPESGPLCAAEVFTSLRDCDNKDKTDEYHGFASYYFDHPTDLPRPLTLTMPGCTLQCNITVRVVEDMVANWFVGWGLDAWGGNPDNMGITCTNTTNTT